MDPTKEPGQAVRDYAAEMIRANRRSGEGDQTFDAVRKRVADAKGRLPYKKALPGLERDVMNKFEPPITADQARGYLKPEIFNRDFDGGMYADIFEEPNPPFPPEPSEESKQMAKDAYDNLKKSGKEIPEPDDLWDDDSLASTKVSASLGMPGSKSTYEPEPYEDESLTERQLASYDLEEESVCSGSGAPLSEVLTRSASKAFAFGSPGPTRKQSASRSTGRQRRGRHTPPGDLARQLSSQLSVSKKRGSNYDGSDFGGSALGSDRKKTKLPQTTLFGASPMQDLMRSTMSACDGIAAVSAPAVEGKTSNEDVHHELTQVIVNDPIQAAQAFHLFQGLTDKLGYGMNSGRFKGALEHASVSKHDRDMLEMSSVFKKKISDSTLLANDFDNTLGKVEGTSKETGEELEAERSGAVATLDKTLEDEKEEIIAEEKRANEEDEDEYKRKVAANKANANRKIKAAEDRHKSGVAMADERLRAAKADAAAEEKATRKIAEDGKAAALKSIEQHKEAMAAALIPMLAQKKVRVAGFKVLQKYLDHHQIEEKSNDSDEVKEEKKKQKAKLLAEAEELKREYFKLQEAYASGDVAKMQEEMELEL